MLYRIEYDPQGDNELKYGVEGVVNLDGRNNYIQASAIKKFNNVEIEVGIGIPNGCSDAFFGGKYAKNERVYLKTSFHF